MRLIKTFKARGLSDYQVAIYQYSEADRSVSNRQALSFLGTQAHLCLIYKLVSNSWA